MTETLISVEGMSCQHCVMRVKKAVEGLAGIRELEVEVGKVKVSFDESKIDRAAIEEAIAKSGYKIIK